MRDTIPPPRTTGWHRWLHRLISAVWFDAVKVKGSLPESGPLLLVSCHRNGAVDGFLLHKALPRLEFMIAGRLVRQWWQRFFFAGIPVERAQDGAGDNAPAMENCVEHLEGGGALCVFPEGTSTLGPRHLPFHSGAARLALAFEQKNGHLPRIVPVGLHYEEAGSFRSRVEVVIGAPLEIGRGERRLLALKRAIQDGLLESGANFQDTLHQEIAEASASLTGGSRHAVLKAWEAGLPDEMARAWQRRAFIVGSFPLRAILAPLALPGYVVNAPVFMASHLAARHLADGPNVVALWKILAGTAAALVWVPIAGAWCAWAWGWKGVAAYAAGTSLSVWLRRPLRMAGRVGRYLLAPRAERAELRELRHLLTRHA